MILSDVIAIISYLNAEFGSFHGHSSVDELVGARKQVDVSSPYDDDADQQQSATTSSCTRFAEPLSAEELHVVQQSRFPKTTVSSATWAFDLFGRLAC